MVRHISLWLYPMAAFLARLRIYVRFYPLEVNGLVRCLLEIVPLAQVLAYNLEIEQSRRLC